VQHVPGSTSFHQHSKQPIKSRDKITIYIKFRLTGLSASTSVLFSYNFPLILGIMYRDMVRDIVSMTFSERNVVSDQQNLLTQERI